jgi:hypothetical protein
MKFASSKNKKWDQHAAALHLPEARDLPDTGTWSAESRNTLISIFGMRDIRKQSKGQIEFGPFWDFLPLEIN